jgi:hypothetical protein
MAEAIFAGKQIKKLAGSERFTLLTFVYTEFPGLTKYFFVRDSPGDASDRNRKNEEPVKLCR